MKFFERTYKRLELIWCRKDGDRYIDYLRRQGMRIGEGTFIFDDPKNVFIDPTRPWLIKIGNDVQIGSGVKILTHGYEWAVIKGTTGEVLGSAGMVSIGNNCFIGMNAVILKGSSIGDNVIIGAGSLIGGKIPSNTVVAGNPCKVICSLEEYRQKIIHKQKYEARELVREYHNVYGTIPDQSLLSEFFWLFASRTNDIDTSFKEKMECVRNYDYSMNVFKTTKSEFGSYREFIKWCFEADN